MGKKGTRFRRPVPGQNSHNKRRSEEEVFRADSLESLKGAPVTDLHLAEKGSEGFLTPSNVKQHIIGITESLEREGAYLKGSLIIFHEDAIKAIESGERKEISLGYKCRLEPKPGSIGGEAYDAIQRDIVVNHVAIDPKGWGRAGADCAIRANSQTAIQGNLKMTEVISLDGIDSSCDARSYWCSILRKETSIRRTSRAI